MADQTPRFQLNGQTFWTVIILVGGIVFFVLRAHIFPNTVTSSDPQTRPLGPKIAAPPVATKILPKVVIRSTPSDAVVILDGREVGRTPLAIDALASGTYALLLRKSCYKTLRPSLTVASEDLQLFFDLDLVCGDLDVASTPVGAEVIVNGTKRGTTPYRMTGVRLGELDLIVRLGWAEKKRRVLIQAGHTSSEPFNFLRPVDPEHRMVWQDNVTGMEFVWVQGGCYFMGNPDSDQLLREINERKKHRVSSFFKSVFEVVTDSGEEEEARDFDIDEAPVHQVCLDGLWVGQKEVTNSQYLQFSEESGLKPEWLRDGNKYNVKTGENEYYKTLGGASLSAGDHPVVGVSWHDVSMFNRWFTQKTSFEARLLSEAEWEYVCRSGGLDEAFAGGADPDTVAWYQDTSEQSSHAVGGLQANGLGLFDLSGNVWEWTLDYYDAEAYASHAQLNPVQQEVGDNPRMVVRGGSWRSKVKSLRCSTRYGLPPDDTNVFLGFRIVMVQEDKK